MGIYAAHTDARTNVSHPTADAPPIDTGVVVVDVTGGGRERLLALLTEHGFRATSAPSTSRAADGGRVRRITGRPASRARLKGVARATGEQLLAALDALQIEICLFDEAGRGVLTSEGWRRRLDDETPPGDRDSDPASDLARALAFAGATNDVRDFLACRTDALSLAYCATTPGRGDEACTGTAAPRRYTVEARRIVVDGRTSVAAIHHDVTALERAELERAQAELEESRRQFYQAQKMESIGRLAGGIAHDFNNLLTAIISFTRFVKDDLSEGDPRREDLTEVLRAADSAAQLTSQLLAFSRRRPVETTRIELNTAVLQIDKMLRRTLGEDIELVILPSPEPAYVMFDAGQLDQLIFNLAVNARDAMPGGGTLTIAMSRKDADPEDPEKRSFAVLTMRDTGTGLSPEIADRIFEPFFTTKGEAGTGLGLATCYGIVMHAGGEIRLDPEVRPGACFRVELPLAGDEDEATESSVRPKSREPVRPGTVVVVEDQPAILRMMFRTLRKIGFAALEARSAEEALALTDRLSARIDLLVTDVVLPGLSGVELMQRLRSRQPALRTVLVSGYLGAEEPMALLDAYTSFLPKPFSAEQLIAKIDALLGPSNSIAAG